MCWPTASQTKDVEEQLVVEVGRRFAGDLRVGLRSLQTFAYHASQAFGALDEFLARAVVDELARKPLVRRVTEVAMELREGIPGPPVQRQAGTLETECAYPLAPLRRYPRRSSFSR